MKIIGINPHLTNLNKNNYLSKARPFHLPSDTVCFREDFTNTDIKSNWINKSLSDQIMKLFGKYKLENLEFVDKNNDLRYSIRALPRQGFLFISEQKILDDGLHYFGAGVNYPAIKPKLAIEGEYAESKTHPYIWEFGGNHFIYPYNADESLSLKLDWKQTAREVENVYRKILKALEFDEVKVYDGTISEKFKTYDDLEMSRKKNKLRQSAYNLLLKQNMGESPTRKAIDELVAGFIKQRNLVDKNLKRKQERASQTDIDLYNKALEVQQQQNKATSPPDNSIKKKHPSAKIIGEPNLFLTHKESNPQERDATVTDIPKQQRKRTTPVSKQDILLGGPIDPNSEYAKYLKELRKQQSEKNKTSVPTQTNKNQDNTPNKPRKGAKIIQFKDKKS